MRARLRLPLGGVLLLCALLAVRRPDEVSAQAKPEGEMRWALYVTLSPLWFDPGEVVRAAHAVLGPVRAARRAGQADARQPHGAEPGRVLDGQRGPAGLRVQAARGAEVPQRRPVHRRGREVQLPARQGLEGPAGEGARGRGRRADPRALRPARAVAGLHDVLRHPGERRRLDRAQEVRRAGRRRRLQEAPDRPRPLQVRQQQARRRAGDGGQRELLAQDALGQAPGVQERRRGHHAPGDAEARRGGRRLPARRAAGRGGQARSQPEARLLGRHRHVLPRLLRPVGSEVAVGRPARAPGGQLRDRPPGAERRGDARRLQADRQPRAAQLRVRAADRARTRTIRRRPRSCWPRPAIRTGSTPASCTSCRRTSRSARPSSATSRRSASGSGCGRWSAPPSSR